MTIASGSKIDIQDILNLVFMPKGIILAYDGDGINTAAGVMLDTADGQRLLPGWYKCDSTGVTYGAPDLSNRFLLGGGSSGVTSGDSAIKLSEANLPKHCHAISSGGETSLSGAHTHTIDVNIEGAPEDGLDSSGNHLWNSHWGSSSDIYTKEAPDHTHALSGSVSDIGQSASIDIIPAYYTMIYLKKIK
jgi:microcystin-dependent protein